MSSRQPHRITGAPSSVVATGAPNNRGMGAMLRNKKRNEAKLPPEEVRLKTAKRIAAGTSTQRAKRRPVTLAPINFGGNA